jgi:hypothetical protein
MLRQVAERRGGSNGKRPENAITKKRPNAVEQEDVCEPRRCPVLKPRAVLDELSVRGVFGPASAASLTLPPLAAGLYLIYK